MNDNAAFYEAFASSYEAHYQTVDAAAAVRQWLARMEALNLVPLEPARRTIPPALLDLGCGPGWHLREWASSGFSVAGMDASPTMLRLTQRNWAKTSAATRQPELFCADLREPGQFESLKARFRVIVAHFNFLNLVGPLELPRVFTSISTLLGSGGIFVTDIALPAAAEDASSLPEASVPQLERKWMLSRGLFVETYWFHSVEVLCKAASDRQLVVEDARAWLVDAVPPCFAPFDDDASKAWMAFRKVQLRV